MLFPTLTFAVFFVAAFIGNWWLRPNRTLWLLFLLAASWTFYGWWDARFVALLAFAVGWNWLLGGLIAAARGDALSPPPSARALLAIAVAVDLGLLGWFKYYGFFATSLVNLLRDLGLDFSPRIVHVTLPIGISFFTFQAISYVVDVFRGTIRPMRPLEFAVYLSFFPQLVAGPIVRASEFAPQLANPADPRFLPMAEAFRLIFSGLFKKVVISSFLASEIVDPVFAVPGQASSLEVLMASYAYAVQIYADFSGYTDIAIGCALLLGFRLPQNFDAPYRARSIQEFWRRWHMTLSRWLRDYLYIPLGGNRGTRAFVYRNLFLTMLLGGLWHGAAWHFVVWGALHGLALVVERHVRERAGWRPSPVLGWLLTFHFVSLTWIFFRAESIGDAFTLLARLLTAPGDAPLVTAPVVAVVAAALGAQFVPESFTLRMQWLYSRAGPALQAATFAFGLVLVDALGPEGVAPFIYFQF